METLKRTDSFDFGTKKVAVEEDTMHAITPSLAAEVPFLRAEHSFDASTLQAEQGRDPNSICLSFSEGDVVFVHWIHELGWGDVTLLHTGKRGWTPINYFSPCTDAKVIPLLSAAANFISEPKSYKLFSYDDGTIEFSFSQNAINEVVAGVRSLLDLSGTLNRESPVAQKSQAIRRHRKALLTELAYLVSVAKQNKRSTDDAVIDRLVRGCFRIVNKAVALLDVWHEEVQSSPPSPHQQIEPADDHPFSKSDSSKRPDLRIDEVSATLCDYLGIFVHRLSSLGSDPTASVQILANTRHCMLACRELLVVVEAISASTTPRNKELERLKDAMFVHTRHLVHAARTLVASLNKPHDEVKKVAENLSNVARECSKLACECSVWCHNVLKLPENDLEPLHPPHPLPAKSNTISSGEMSSRNSSQQESASSRPSSTSSHDDSLPTKECSSEDDASLDLDAPPQLQNADEDDDIHSQSPERCPSHVQSRNASVSSGHSPRKPLSPATSLNRLSIQSDARGGTDDNSDIMVRNGRVVAGTLPALVSWLGEPETAEFSKHVFLLCFRLFSSPQEVASIIYEQNDTELALKWIKSYWKAEDAPAIDVLKNINNAALRSSIEQRSANETVSQLVPPPILDRSFDNGSMLDVSKLRSNSNSTNGSSINLGGSTTTVNAVSSSTSNSRRTSISRGMGMVRRVSHEDIRLMSTPWTLKFGNNNASDIGTKFLEFDPADVAAQLYLMDWEVFSKIEPEELLDQRFAKTKRSLGMSPHVVEIVTASNHLSAFVGETVLGSNLSVKTRRHVIRMWIRIASILFDIGNFNSLVTILSTLRSSSIVRLRKVWDTISPKKMSLVTSLGRLAAPDRNFADLRNAMRVRSDSSCIPYVGLYLSDLTLIDEGNPKYRTHNGKSLINFDRYARACDVISKIQRFQQQSPPDVTHNESLKLWLKKEMTKSHDAMVEDVDAQWRRSCIIEPPA